MTKIAANKAFNLSVAGKQNEQTANINNQFLQNYYSGFTNITGWLGEALDRTKQLQDQFMKSRLWEFSARMSGEDGIHVDKYQIGFLRSVESQRAAVGFMRDIIMANPKMMELYLEERISGYDGEFSAFNTGIGRDNIFFNKVNHGFVNTDNRVTKHTHYYNNIDGVNHYSKRERLDSLKTWIHTESHLSLGMDPSSIIGSSVLTPEQVLENKEKQSPK